MSKMSNKAIEDENNKIYLYMIPNDSKIFCEASDGSDHIIFRRKDGMYSVCETGKGGLLHLSVMAELEKVDGGYKLIVN